MATAQSHTAQREPEQAETYIGDGLYASFDGWQITLRAPRFEGDHFVCLDAHTLESFERYVATLRATAESA